MAVSALLVLTLGPLLAAPVAAAPEEISGHAQALSGDRLQIGATQVRLRGLSVPQGEAWGALEARINLFKLVADKTVMCQLGPRAEGGVRVGQCAAAGMDLAALMVDQGFARDCPKESGGRYRIQEGRAKEAGSLISENHILPERCGKARQR